MNSRRYLLKANINYFTQLLKDFFYKLHLRISIYRFIVQYTTGKQGVLLLTNCTIDCNILFDITSMFVMLSVTSEKLYSTKIK